MRGVRAVGGLSRGWLPAAVTVPIPLALMAVVAVVGVLIVGALMFR
ncbi:hypothetical protein [Nocardia carnea]|nr:hypothetical protein [Nocardia carnea]